MTPNHRERQIMQHLRGRSWVKAMLISDSPIIIQRLLSKGWIERQGSDRELAYRITDAGLAAKKAPVRIL